MNDLDKILTEIYELDESLKEHDEDLKRIVSQMIDNKPDTQFNEDFKENLRAKLSEKIAELKEKDGKKVGILNLIFNFGTMKYVGVFATGFVIALMIPFFYKNYKSPEIQTSEFTNMQEVKKTIKIPVPKTTKTTTPTKKTDKTDVDEMNKINVGDGHVRPPNDEIKNKPNNQVTSKQKTDTTPAKKAEKTDTTVQKRSLGSTSDLSSSSGGGTSVGTASPSMAMPMMTTAIESADDAQPMEDLGHGYKKDDKNVYYKEKTIEKADPATFKVLNSNYSKDKNNVYYLGKLIKDADSVSFEVTDQYNAKDKNNEYYKEKIKDKEGQ